jgi:hemolysin activation/secretion protein
MTRAFVCALILFSPLVHAQQQPDAGRVLDQLREPAAVPVPKPPPTRIEERPQAQVPAGQRFAVKRLRITGNKSFSESELLPLVQQGEGRELSLADLNGLAGQVTRYYRDRGYLLARAYIPAQDVTEGNIEIAVQEGLLGAVEIRNNIGLSGSALSPLSNLRPGEPVRLDQLESSLLAIADVPGADIRSTLRPGTAVGASDLLVEVDPGRGVTGSIDMDNFGGRFTGAHRVGANLNINNPLNLGDQIGIAVQKSDGDLTYGRASYQLPVGPAGTRIGAAYSDLRYGLGKDFAALRATGTANVASLYLTHPLLRTRASSVFAQLQYDDKRLDDRVGATNTETNKTLRNWSLGLSASTTDDFGGGGSNGLSVNYVNGHLDLDPTSAALDAATARSRGGFSLLSATLQRTQRLTDEWSLFASYMQQHAGKNLNSSEKMSLGGPYGVKAYPNGEASGDEGRAATLELRWQATRNWQVQGFYNHGSVKINKNTWVPGNNERRLWGYGLGFTWADESGWVLRSFLAWRGQERPTSEVDRSPRVWVQLRKIF